ncbi:MAG TPA: hypothetical protein VD866_23850 [Urbifossiella sp.]|nr:hypothetical protein [Urbifossiella sp.]
MSKPSVLVMDTLSDRRDIWHLLNRLAPKARVRFVGWCCERITNEVGHRPVPRYNRELIDLAYRDDSADLRVTNSAWTDLLNLSSQWGLDLGVAAVELERRVRQKP